jgi:hypothetical protein
LGQSFLAGRRIPIRLLQIGLIGLLCPILLAACGEDAFDSPGPTPRSVADPAAVEDSTGPVLPELPWFDLPDDWNQQHPNLSPNAKLEAHFASLAERQVVANPADGAGRAWLEAVQAIDPQTEPSSWQRRDGNGVIDGSRPSVPASSAQRIEIVFEVGPHGIDEGGVLFIMSEPFWSWSLTQVEDPNALGYTTAVSQSGGVDLVPLVDGATFRVDGRALEPKERIDIVVGAGPRGTIVDEFAELGSEILIAVDADGDGVRAWIEDSARIDIAARGGSRIVALGPAEVAPGDPIEVNLSILDSRGNLAHWPRSSRDEDDHANFSFSIERIGGPALEMLGLEESIDEEDVPNGPYRLRFKASNEEGTIRLSIRGRGALEGFETDVNPIVVRRSARRLVWADLHGHSQLSDGTGTPEDYFRYARDVARLDAIALTDHDHWGIRPLDESPELAARILRTALEFHEPERFVTIPGYEWTSWLHGHRHVLYFDEEAPIHSSIDFETDRPDELWAALRGQPALTFAHHSAGEPVATNWSFRPDSELEPLTEISSIHGMSEADDAPLPPYGAIRGNFVRDVLLRGARLGFIGSGDSHDGHPGLAQLATGGQSGLAGIFTDSLDRPGLLEAMRKRRTFATTGIRPWLSVSIDETFMGGSFPASTDPETRHRLRIRYEATAAIERIDLIRGDRIAHLEGSTVVDGNDDLSVDFERLIPRLAPGEFHYVRIIQEGGGVAWSSPIFVDQP